MARANQGPQTKFDDRAGQNLVAVAPSTLDRAKRYRFVTTDWSVKNAKDYFGDDAPVFTEIPALKVKAAVMQALK